MKNQNRRKKRPTANALKGVVKFLANQRFLSLCILLAAGFFTIRHYHFTRTTERHFDEKETIQIGPDKKAPPSHSDTTVLLPPSSPVQQIFDEVAEINRLNRKLHGQPELPSEMLCPTSIELAQTEGRSWQTRLPEMKASLDQELKRLREAIGRD